MDESRTESVASTEHQALPSADIRTCLVTGAAGFLGSHLVEALLDLGCYVHGFDLVEGSINDNRLQFYQGDIREYENVLKAMDGVDTVFHTAAVVDLLHYYDDATRKRSMDINVGGTHNVIRACQELGVARLVHTSSLNVVFDGTSVELARETDPYPTKFNDLYSESKFLAEREVLAANGSGGLLTCAIRPSGIYGPRDKLILPRVVTSLDRGLVKVLVGDCTALSENTYIDNLIEGHLKAALRLEPGSPVGGQAYFINDGEYVNNLMYFRPIMEGLGFSFPTKHIPSGPLLLAARLAELAHKYLKTADPGLRVMEVIKLTVNQPASIEKAQRELGYGPQVSYDEAMQRCMPYCRELLETREKVDRPHLGYWLSILGGLTALGLVAFHPAVWGAWSEYALGTIPRWIYQLGFAAACLTHVYKGQEAVRLAERAGLQQTSMGWGWQTLLLGFPSLNLLRARIAWMKSRS